MAGPVVGGDGPQPASVGDVAQPVARGSVVEVDERDGPAVEEHVVARRRVVVADDLVSSGELRPGGCVVQPAQQSCGRGQGLVGEVVEVRRHPAVDEVQHLTSMLIDAH
jgi:hypothetical protein